MVSCTSPPHTARAAYVSAKPFLQNKQFFGEQMLLRIQVQRAFRPSGWWGLPSCLQRVRSEQHVRAGSNSSETCQTCDTCGEQLCSSGSLQKALDQWCVGYKAMHHAYAVAQTGFLEGWQPLLTQSEVLGCTCYATPYLSTQGKSRGCHFLDKISKMKKRKEQEQL